MTYKRGASIPTTEHAEQSAVVDWAQAHIGKWPELDWLYAIINGIPLPGSMLQRVRIINYMKAEGLKPGVADLCLPSARGGYFGMYLELKKKGGVIREGQGEFLAFVSEQGYFDSVCYSADEAIEILTTYLNWPRTVAVKAKKG